MQHTSIIQVLKLNDPIKGTSQKTGRPYDIQDCECLLLNESGTVEQVGVLTIPNDLRGKVEPGTYMGTFSLRADRQTRRIGSVLTGLTPITSGASTPVKARA